MSTIATQTATPATLSKQIAPTTAISAIMRPKQKADVQTMLDTKAMPTGVKKMLAVADALVDQFGQLKIDVLDRSDRALWAYLGEVNELKDTIAKQVGLSLFKARSNFTSSSRSSLRDICPY